MEIGEGTQFVDPRTNNIDVTRPWMIKMGQNVIVTAGVVILTHDYGWGVLKKLHGEIVGSAQKTVIGDNVYIGMNTIILGGVTIGSNVVIGAGSIVSRDVPDNCVAAGNPVRVIRSIDEYYEKRKVKQIEEAVLMVKEYYRTYKQKPPKKVLREHFFLFEDNYEELIPEYKSVCALIAGSEDKTITELEKHRKTFKDYDDFIEYCLRE